MLSSRKPFQLVLSTLSLAGIATLASADEACCAGGEKGCTVDCSEAIAHVTSLFEKIVTPVASCSEAAKATECSSAKATECSGAKATECSGSEGERAAKVAKDGAAPWKELSKILATRPEAWKIVKPLVVAKFASEASEAVRNNALSLLAWQYSEPAVAIASEIAEAYPSTQFSRDHVIAFAEAGSKRFWKAAQVLHESDQDILPSALLAMHGKCSDGDSVRKLLVERASRPAAPGEETERFVASLALKKLGDPEYLESARADLRDSVLTALDRDDLELAGRLALTAGFLDEACSAYTQTRLSFLDIRLAEYRNERAGDVRSADQIFALVERLFAL